MTTTKSERVRAEIGKQLQHDSRRRNITILLAIAAMLLIGWVLHQIGIAITTDRTPLSCTYAKTDAHTHDETCYRNGILVCPVPEREEHHHTESCYSVQQVLVCELDEESGHVHDNTCYEEKEVLICGQEETTGPHIHGPECFGQDVVATDASTEFDGDVRDEAGNVLVSVHVTAPAGALPADATMEVLPVDENVVANQVRSEIDKDEDATTIDSMLAVDITFRDSDGNRIEPKVPVTVTMTSPTIADTSTDEVIVHVGDDAQTETMDELDEENLRKKDIADVDDKVSFESESFSMYVLVSIRKSVRLTSSDGTSYEIDVTCPVDAGMPMDAELSVVEIPYGTDEYNGYYNESAQAIGKPVTFARMFDINILDGEGNEIQPAEGSHVDVSIRIANLEHETGGNPDDTKVVHFGDGTTETIDIATSGDTVEFPASGFSVYAIVSTAEDVEVLSGTVSSMEELAAHSDHAMHLSVIQKGATGPNYFKGTIGSSQGIIELTTNINAAAAWYMEPVTDGSDGLYRMKTIVSGEPQYLINTTGNMVGLSPNQARGIVFSVSLIDSGRFMFQKQGEDLWLQYSGGGKGIRFWPANTDPNNVPITISYTDDEVADDPYSLDGKTYGLAYRNGTISAAGLMSNEVKSGSADALEAVNMLVRPDVIQRDGYLLMARDIDLAEWTFHNLSGNTYNITTVVDGETYYMSIDANGVRLVSSPDDTSCSISVASGTGDNKGQYRLSSGKRTLMFNSTDKFVSTSSTSATAWLSLVEKSSRVGDDNFTSYLANKVNASDTETLQDGMQVVLYTRIWNEDTLHYDYYVVDYDGVLIQCYDRGDSIQWVGNKMNTALWKFTEYHNSDGTPNYYYELRNVYSKKYLAPQIQDGQILSDNTIGINLNGRRYGDDYTSIVAWDDPYYEYASFAIDGNALTSCSLAQGIDFYFAIVEQPEEGVLTTTETVDNTDYGITMKMIDFNNGTVSGIKWDSVQNPFFGGEKDVDGLLSTKLESDGYPLTTELTGHVDSVGDIFTNMTPVNHLFLKSAYEENGYFEYDSTQNFAHLGDDGNFVVYNQLGCIGTSTRKTRTHGQFMPYNDLNPTSIAPVTNQTDVLTNPLPDINSRKGETLYMIPDNVADYFFGMEMEASFTQTESGLDAWGHDIIFEFSGDDDFWLYVDGELVLDLGGVHQAMTGSVNFRTGVVKRSGSDANAAARSEDTTLYEMFRSNYVQRNPDATQAEVTAYLDGIFTTNAHGQRVFKDYTTHTMKVFYMERGAGASNLRMRFNLASATPNSVTLGKTISGTERADYALAEFPYQVWYTQRADGEVQEHLLTEKTGKNYNVTYSGKSVPVKHMDSYTPPNGTASYPDVFFLKPGQLATIQLPNDVVKYRIVECGIGTSVYDAVTANDVPLTGTATQNGGRKDYSTELVPVNSQPRVIYNNHVSPDALRTLTITKKLYDADGTTLVHDDPTGFSFRLYLTSENNDLAYANMHPYFIKDAHGNYCVWNPESQGFTSIGKTEYESLTDAERQQCTFHTSPSGSISKIPADHSVEVRELVIGTKFKVIERDSELPAGYTRREADGYVRLGGSYIADGETNNAGTIRDNSDPAIEVRNQRGWGLTAEKDWSDASFMSSHETIYLAVYIADSHGNLGTEPIEGTVRRLKGTATSVYWYFPSLDVPDFGRYVVREVTLGNAHPTVGDDGTVTDTGAIEPIDAGGTLSVQATLTTDNTKKSYDYEVQYEPGTASGAVTGLQNVRTDVVSNSRPGIRIVKTDWSGHPLAGASFSIQDSDGDIVGAEEYVSDEDGLVTTAYLANGTYSLVEENSPTGYFGLTSPVLMTISGTGNRVNVSGDPDDADKYSVSQSGGMPVVTIRNQPMTIDIMKEDEHHQALAGATFSIYRQTIGTDGLPMPEESPVAGWEELTSGEDGIVTTGLQDLGPGTYYLIETTVPDGYLPVSEDITFTIGQTGTVTLGDSEYVRMESVDDSDGTPRVTIIVKNEPRVWVRLMKVDISDIDHPLSGAKFDLFRLAPDGTRKRPTLMPGMTSGEDGILVYEDESVFELAPGHYELVETKAPDGYIMRDEPIEITVAAGTVNYEEGMGLSHNGRGATYDSVTNTWTLRISNTSGYALPRTVGVSYSAATLIGSLLIAASLPYLIVVARRRRHIGDK